MIDWHKYENQCFVRFPIFKFTSGTGNYYVGKVGTNVLRRYIIKTNFNPCKPKSCMQPRCVH